jgi:small-conductance mechanosensitive channel
MMIMDVSALIAEYLKIDYLYIVAIMVGAYLVGKIVAPVIVWIGRKINEKTKSSLEIMILNEIDGPLESFFFIVIFELAIIYMPSYFQIMGQETIETVSSIALIIFIFYLLYKAVHVTFRWYYEEGRKETNINFPVDLLPFFKRLIQIFLILIAFILCSAKLGIDIVALATLPLIVAIIAGLAAQEIVTNMLYGLAMQLERNIKYGAYVRLPLGEVVKVKKIGLKTTKLADLYGNIMLVSNSEFAKMRITKLEENDAPARVSVPFEISKDISLNSLLEHIKDRVEKSRDIVHIRGSISMTVSKFSQNWVQGNITLMAVDLSHTIKINDAVTRAIREFVNRKA